MFRGRTSKLGSEAYMGNKLSHYSTNIRLTDVTEEWLGHGFSLRTEICMCLDQKPPLVED